MEGIHSSLLKILDEYLQNVSEHLADLNINQQTLLEKIKKQNDNIGTQNELPQVMGTLSMIASYQIKAQQIRKEMLNTTDRVYKLKRRTEKLREAKEAQELALAERMLKEKEYERNIMAKPSKTLQTSLEIESLPTDKNTFKKSQ